MTRQISIRLFLHDYLLDEELFDVFGAKRGGLAETGKVLRMALRGLMQLTSAVFSPAPVIAAGISSGLLVPGLLK